MHRSQKRVDLPLLAYCWFWLFPVKVTAESSTGFPPSPGFPESSAAKELSGSDDVLSTYFLVVTGNLYIG